jgi:Zn-dependent protease with chaperone function
MKVQGQFYPQGSTKCLTVDIHFSCSGVLSLRTSEQDLCVDVPRPELNIKDKLGSIPREIVLQDCGLLSVPASPEVDQWLAVGTKNSTAFKMENNRNMVLASLVLVPVFLFVFFKYMIPGFAVHFANYVPDSAVKLASKHTLYSLDKTMLDPSEMSEEQQQSHIEHWHQTLDLLELDEQSYNLNFRLSDRMGANAFALPDGTVVVTDALLELIEHDNKLLQAILLHEIGHVENMHSMRLIAETLVTSLAIDYFFGDLGGMVEVFGGLSNTIMHNQFSQKLEWEADNFALAKLKALGQDPENFALAMEKLAQSLPQQSELDAFMQSHPLMKERFENARRIGLTPSN